MSVIKVSIVLLLSTFIFSSNPAINTDNHIAKEVILTNHSQNDSILYNIQDKITTAFKSSLKSSTVENLEKLISKLEKNASPVSKYWIAYAKYKESICYSKMNNKKNSEKVLDEAIDILRKGPKSSEGFALLGTLVNYSIQFNSNMKAAAISNEARKYFDKSLELEPKNLRAYLGLATLDFHTPKMYGGKTKTVSYITKALEQPDQPMVSPVLPSWGRKTAYMTIIKFYYESGEKEKAQKYIEESKQKFK